MVRLRRQCIPLKRQCTFVEAGPCSPPRLFLPRLVERLPKESSTAADETMGSTALFERAVGRAASELLAAPWVRLP